MKLCRRLRPGGSAFHCFSLNYDPDHYYKIHRSVRENHTIYMKQLEYVHETRQMITGKYLPKDRFAVRIVQMQGRNECNVKNIKK